MKNIICIILCQEIGHHRIENQVTILPLTSGSVACDCPLGYVIVGGGFRANSYDVIVAQGEPTATYRYIASGYNSSPFNSYVLRVSALCARLAN